MRRMLLRCRAVGRGMKVVARALVPAASTLVSTHFSSPYFRLRRRCGIGRGCDASHPACFRAAPKSVETSLDAADTSVRATCSAHIRSMTSGGLIALLLLAAPAFPATRPHYGGVLRVEVRESIETADPPQTGNLAELAGGFTIVQWEGGRRAVYSADANAAGGRPFLDSVEIQMGRALHDSAIALNLGKTDLVEFDPSEPQRPGSGHKVWSSAPVRLLVLLFGPRIEDARVREALALAVDRNSIHSVMLQRQGEVSGALLPQWLSGDAFLFPVATDVAKARALLAGVPPSARTLSLGVADPANRRIADRIALDRKSTRLNSSHLVISYAVFCLKKNKSKRSSSPRPRQARAAAAAR